MTYTDEQFRDAAKKLGAALCLGKGKTDKIEVDVREKVGTKCPYCATRLSLTNCTYDHKTAIGSVARRKRSGKINRDFDNWDNLHLICKPCNMAKSDLNHDEFLGLIEFWGKFPKAKKKMLERFRKERMSYRRRPSRTA